MTLMIRLFKIFAIGISLVSCNQSKEIQENSNTVIDLPKKLKEISGLTYIPEKNTLYAIEDSGNKNIVYQLDFKGKIINEITIEGVENKDWEDITSDEEGNLYIGDFGNNDNTRKDLAIYKVRADEIENNKITSVEKISFYYPEQIDFPPKKSKRFYDVEAFILYQNNFYLFTKNRSKNFDGTTLLYKVQNTPNNKAAILIGSYKTQKDYNNGTVTGAAMNSDETKVVLLGHSKVWLFENFTDANFFNGEKKVIDLEHYSQKEGITFKDDATILIADERVKKSGGKVYQYSLSK
ncbi:SdiA-regulated domain-containing protein [Flavobacterium sp.]|uniref:SdiA-regulated domain-containing protein n=1 Tax=Flavobacterium sp. TaxID=239 RepID=UPI00262DE864|nr:SdiA-regulated domain-containing protein [Flavobacterium sp.]